MLHSQASVALIGLQQSLIDSQKLRDRLGKESQNQDNLCIMTTALDFLSANNAKFLV